MLKNLKIRQRMLISYAVIILFTVISSVLSVSMLQTVGGSLSDFYDKQFQTVNEAWKTRRAVYASQSSLFQSIIESDTTAINKAIEVAETEFAVPAVALATLRTTFQGDTSLIDDCMTLIDQANTLRQQIDAFAKQNKDTEAYEILEGQYIPITDKLRQNVVEISNQADQNAFARVEQANSLTTVSIVTVVIISSLCVVIGIIFGIVISNGIRKPVEEIQAAAKALSEGDLKSVITYESKDELGSLADSMRTSIKSLSSVITDLTFLMQEIAHGNFNVRSKNPSGYVQDFEALLLYIREMTRSLSGTMRKIGHSSDQVASGSEQVSGGAQALSQGATEQASSVEELAATINEISVHVNQNAEAAKGASIRVGKVGEDMDNTNQQMSAMTSAMSEISQSSSEIGKIIKTIEDIAFQTNILALNAAVEAARAGAAGKGFAVVADEVRNLASKSAEASKNTSALIEGSIRSVENGTKIAQSAASAMQLAVEGAREVRATVDQIAEASNVQSHSIVQVSQGIDQISSVVQTNSATAEESAAASEELSSQSQILKGLMTQFVLREDDESAKEAPAIYSGHTQISQKSYTPPHDDFMPSSPVRTKIPQLGSADNY